MKSFIQLSFVSALAVSAWAQTTTDDLIAAAPDVVGGLNMTEAITNTTTSEDSYLGHIQATYSFGIAGIDLSALPFAATAFDYMSTMVTTNATSRRARRTNPGNAIDVHCMFQSLLCMHILIRPISPFGVSLVW